MSTELTDIEKRIFEELAKQDPKIADIYYGAIAVLERNVNSKNNLEQTEITQISFPSGKQNPDRIFQSAHSIRETLNRLLKKIEVPEQEDKNKERIRKFSDPQDSLPSYLHGLFDELFELHNWFTNVSHHGEYPSETDYYKKLDLYNRILLRIMIPHFESIREIDELLTIAAPSEENFEKLKPLISRNFESYSYFFRNADANWLSLLTKGPFFKNPPMPKRKDNFIQYPSWPESNYLVRIAAKKPKEVLDLILSCNMPDNKDDRNPRVLEDFVRVGISLPCEQAKQLAELIVDKKWEDPRSFSLLEDEISDLATKLSEECNDVDTSLKLMNLLLDLELWEIPAQGVVAK